MLAVPEIKSGNHFPSRSQQNSAYNQKPNFLILQDVLTPGHHHQGQEGTTEGDYNTQTGNMVSPPHFLCSSHTRSTKYN